MGADNYKGIKLTGADDFEMWKVSITRNLTKYNQNMWIETENTNKSADMDGEQKEENDSRGGKVDKARVSSKIRQSMDKAHQMVIASMSDPWDLYNTMIMRYEGNNQVRYECNNEGRYYDLCLRLFGIVDQKTMSIQDKLNLMNRLRSQMMTLKPDNKVGDWLLIFLIKASVDQEQFKITFEIMHHSTIELSLDEVIARLKAQEIELGNKGIYSNTANWAGRGPGGFQGRGRGGRQWRGPRGGNSNSSSGRLAYPRTRG
ncbi:hypothetical protein HYFRA_00010055 [Hymenoscyphus fraxineus]|uniref:Uncharacterized protein n=1 Tax=Hymenoscyphus fraxineus TaxID=746836 RepID=A0A9N9KV02_9HELO|nr:hypothetical protein HYFRA_00010055 [Hymenoscyphus fraxineus]